MIFFIFWNDHVLALSQIEKPELSRGIKEDTVLCRLKGLGRLSVQVRTYCNIPIYI